MTMRKGCITAIRGTHSWVSKLFYFPQLLLTFPLLCNEKTVPSLSHSDKQVFQKQRQLLIPHSPLSSSWLTCRPLDLPGIQSKRPMPLGDAWLHIKFLQSSQRTCVNYSSGLRTPMIRTEQLISEEGKPQRH